MELDNAMDDELNKGGIWAPVTPAKRNSNSINNGVDCQLGAAEIPQFSENPPTIASEKETYGPDRGFRNVDRDHDFGGLHECVIGEISDGIKVDGGSKSHNENAQSVFGMDANSPFTTPERRSSKRSNNGIHLDKKPSKKPKMKRHRPRIRDECKIPKTLKPKSGMEPSTPIPKTPRRKIPKSTKRQKCVKEGRGKANASICEDGRATNRRVVKPCKKSIHFNLENDMINQKDVKEAVTFIDEDNHYEKNFDCDIDKSKIQDRDIDNKLFSSDSFGENSCKELPKPAFSSSLTECNEPRISRRRKSSTKFSWMLDFNLNLERQDFEDCLELKKIVDEWTETENRTTRSEPQVASNLQPSYQVGSLRVYHRIFKPNECLKNSRKLGPNCPSIYKKTRMQRRKTTTFSGFWNATTLDQCRRYGKATNFGSSRTFKKSKTATKRNKDRKGSSKSAVSGFKLLVGCRRLTLHAVKMKRLIKKDPKSFECVLNFLLNWGRKRKRSKRLNQRRKVASSVVRFDMANQSKAFIVHPENLALQSIGKHQVPKRVMPLTNALLELAIKCLKRLSISDDCNQLVVRDNKVNGAIVLHKRRKPPAKIDFDKRTLIAWKQLMENDGSISIEKTDKDTETFWEEERKAYRERILLFISLMHLIQGDRRFSEWKGSVLDSIVGVYLTQNVTDHTSSSIFMAVAARFPPLDIDDICEENIILCSQESTGSNTEEPGLAENNKEQFRVCPAEQDMSYQCVEIGESPISSKENAKLGLVEDEVIVEDSHICSTEKIEDDVIVEDAVQTFPDAASDENLTNISVSCSTDKSTSYRELLQMEETDFLKQFYAHQEGEMSQMALVFAETPSLSKLHEVEVKELNSVGKPNDNKGKKKANNHQDGSRKSSQSESTPGGKKGKVEPEIPIDWDELRRTYFDCQPRDAARQVDSVDWDAVRKAPFEELSKAIKARGMNNILAGRIKDFLDRMVKDHGSLDLEWLRNVPPDKAKDYLLSILGLGLKSVECLRLLTLHHVAFPVDTNVGRIVVRLGWVPLQPLPEDVQMHLLNQYPMVDTIQKYLWPRLCTLDQQTLYELHYQLITFGKVFCTKRNPNCNACPMRGQCKHFASAFASAKLRLPGMQDKTTSMPEAPVPTIRDPAMQKSPNLLQISDGDFSEVKCESCTCEPIVEVPPSPEPMTSETPTRDIEDFYYESEEDEIPTIRLNAEEFKENLMDFVGKTSFPIPGSDMSKALVAVRPEAASIPIPKLMAVHRLRTVHQVYEIPDNHPLLAGFKKRERDDPSPYLIRIWTTDELANSSPRSGKRGSGNTQNASTCLGNTVEEQNDQTVKGTILIPCRTANRGTFPLNGTYFQVNEVFADHQSSRRPISVPREWIWRLRRRSLYCGKSATSIFKGMSMEEIQFAFWRGFICIRGVDRGTRKPRPLSPKFHPRNKSKLDEEDD